jgi:hypothetical protein
MGRYCEQYLNDELSKAGIVLTGPAYVNARRDAGWARKVGGKAGLYNFVRDLIAHHRAK